MDITFSPELPSGEEWADVRENITNELAHFEGRFVDFPSQRIVRLDSIPHRASGIAEGPDGTRQVEITYDLLSPHTARYQYVAGAALVELPHEPDA